jgi:hypothetical protein
VTSSHSGCGDPHQASGSTLAIQSWKKASFIVLPFVAKSVAISCFLHKRSHVCRSDLLTLKNREEIGFAHKTFSFQIQDQTTAGRIDRR